MLKKFIAGVVAGFMIGASFIVSSNQAAERFTAVAEDNTAISFTYEEPYIELAGYHFSYEVNVSVDENGVIYIYPTKKGNIDYSAKGNLFKVITPSNYHYSKDYGYSHVFSKTENEDGTITWIFSPDSQQKESPDMLIPIGNRSSEISFYGWKGKDINTYTYKPRLIGDINNDGLVNAVDASYVLNYYAYLSTGGDAFVDIDTYIKTLT